MSDTSPVSNPASPPGSPTLLGDKQDDDVAFSAFRAKLQAVIAQWDTEKLSEKYIQLMYKMEGQKRQHEYELISASATGEKKGKEDMQEKMDDMTIQCKKAEVLLLLQCKKAEEEKEFAEDMVKTLKTEHETALLSASATGEKKGKEDMQAQMDDMTIQCKKECKKVLKKKKTAEDLVKTLKTEHETALLSASATGEKKGKEDMQAQMDDVFTQYKKAEEGKEAMRARLLLAKEASKKAKVEKEFAEDMVKTLKTEHETALLSASATGEKKGKEAMLAQMDDMTIQCKKAEEEKETAEDMVKTLKTEHETALLSASATGENKGKEDMRAQMEDDLKALQRQAGDIANISPKNPDGSVLEELIKKEFIAIGERLEKCNDGRPSPGTGDHMGCDFVNDSKESNGNNDEFGADCDTGIPKLVRDVKRNEKDFGILTAQHLTIKCQSKTYAQMAVVHYHDCLIVLVPGIRHTKTLGTVLKQALELGRQERKCT